MYIRIYAFDGEGKKKEERRPSIDGNGEKHSRPGKVENPRTFAMSKIKYTQRV